ncbi:MAG: discoidin domain-containing protein [Spirochaetota bacterium]
MKFFRVLFLLPCLLFADVAEDDSYQWRYRISASASSHLKEQGKPADKYDADKVIDGSVATAWCASTANATDGVGESIQLQFRARQLKQIHLVNGYAASRSLYFANNRIKKARLEITSSTGRSFTTTVNFAEKCSSSTASAPCATSLADYQVARFKETCAEKIDVTILEVYPGKQHHDTCIAEIALQDDTSFCN